MDDELYYATREDGNCFFYAVFGEKNGQGIYELANAQQMRENWSQFLKSYDSLSDQRMPASLRKELKTTFSYMLRELPSELQHIDALRNLILDAKDKFDQAEERTKILRQEIRIQLRSNTLSKKDYDIFCKPRVEKSKTIPKYELLEEIDDGTLNDIIADFGLFDSVKLFLCPNLTQEEFKERYTSEYIEEQFCKRQDFYKCYTNAIANQSYYVFLEEIPILASIYNQAIFVSGEETYLNTRLEFSPNQEILEAYKNFRGSNYEQHNQNHDVKYIYLQSRQARHFSRTSEDLYTKIGQIQREETLYLPSSSERITSHEIHVISSQNETQGEKMDATDNRSSTPSSSPPITFRLSANAFFGQERSNPRSNTISISESKYDSKLDKNIDTAKEKSKQEHPSLVDLANRKLIEDINKERPEYGIEASISSSKNVNGVSSTSDDSSSSSSASQLITNVGISGSGFGQRENQIAESENSEDEYSMEM